MQPARFAVIPQLCRLDGVLRQVVAQDIKRIHPMHPLTSLFFCAAGVTLHTGFVQVRPFIKPLEVDKVVAQPRHGQRG